MGDDGITNGTSGILRKIQHLTDSPIPSIVWLQFDEPKVGHSTRRKYKNYYSSAIPSSLTPIFAINQTFHVGYGHKAVQRSQFPLRPATAKTIHKAQGATLNKVVVHMGNRKLPHAHYVAFSRVRNKSDLHILHLAEDKISVDSRVVEEMDRLRTQSCLTLCYNPPYQTMENNFQVIFHNARSLHLHFQHISTDPNILAADVVCFAETRLTHHEDHLFHIQHFKLICKMNRSHPQALQDLIMA